MKKIFQLMLVAPMIALLALACAPVTEGVVSGAAEATTEEALEAFDIFDEDTSGDISRSEYDENVTAFDSEMEFEELDTNGDGFVSEGEFDGFDG